MGLRGVLQCIALVDVDRHDPARDQIKEFAGRLYEVFEAVWAVGGSLTG